MITIKNRWNGTFIAEFETLRGAYLRGAYLRGADLRGADLHGAMNAPLVISGLRWTVQISGTGWMQIGCQKHIVAEWACFDDERISAMEYGALDFLRDHKTMLMALCEQWKHPEEKA